MGSLETSFDQNNVSTTDFNVVSLPPDVVPHSSSSFPFTLDRKLDKTKICDVLRKEFESDYDDGRVKLARFSVVCDYKKNNRKCKSTHTTKISLLEPNVESLLEKCKTEILRIQKEFTDSKSQHEFQDIFSCTLEILTLYTL